MKRLLILYLLLSWSGFAVSVSSTNAVNRTVTTGTTVRITVVLNSTAYSYDQYYYPGEGSLTGLHGLEIKMRTVNTPSWATGCSFHLDTPHWYGRWVFHKDDGTDNGPSDYGGTGSNSRCSAKAISSTDNGTTAQFDIDVTFTSLMVGTVYVWHSWSVDYDSSSSGDVYQGTMTVALPNSAPTNIGVSGIPAHLNYGVPVTLTGTWRDPDGYGNLSYMHLLIRDSVNGANSCYLYFTPGSNQVSLRDAGNTTWGTAITMGSGALDNGWCRVTGAGSSYGTSGTTDRTATIVISFYPTMLAYGTLNHFLYAADSSANSGWSGTYGGTALHSGPKLIVTSNR